MLILKNLKSLYNGSQLYSDVNLIINGNTIEAVISTADMDFSHYPSHEIIDCSGCIAVPGFVNTHHHFYQVLTRNLPEVQNAELFEWLVFLYEKWKNIDSDAVYYSSLCAAAELMKTGCTCSTDHHYLYPSGFSGDIMGLQFEAAGKLGLRFSPTRGSMSLSRKDGGLPPDSVVQTGAEIIKDSERVIKDFHDADKYSMQRIILAPCSPFSVTTELMKETALLAREKNVLLHTHLAETHDENDFCINKHGIRPLELMKSCDFTGHDVSFAHGIHFNDEELSYLKDSGCSICHCPSSNMRLGSGIARVREMIDRGINVSLAVDGSASNDSCDMLGEIRTALMLQRIKYGASGLTVKEAFGIASAGGAKTLNYDTIGYIKQGYAADVAVFDISGLEYAGSESDPLASLIFCGHNHTTKYTIVNGKITVCKGELTGFDEDELSFKTREISSALLNKF